MQYYIKSFPSLDSFNLFDCKLSKNGTEDCLNKCAINRNGKTLNSILITFNFNRALFLISCIIYTRVSLFDGKYMFESVISLVSQECSMFGKSTLPVLLQLYFKVF